MLLLSYRVIYTHSPPTPPHPLLSTSSLYYHLLRWTPLLSYFLNLLSTFAVHNGARSAPPETKGLKYEENHLDTARNSIRVKKEKKFLTYRRVGG